MRRLVLVMLALVLVGCHHGTRKLAKLDGCATSATIEDLRQIQQRSGF